MTMRLLGVALLMERLEVRVDCESVSESGAGMRYSGSLGSPTTHRSSPRALNIIKARTVIAAKYPHSLTG